LSIIAIIISVGQLFFDNPYFLKYFNKVELVSTEIGINKAPNSNRLESEFLIENIGDNTAKNVEIQLRVLRDSKVFFMTNTFSLINPEVPKTPVRNLIYRCDAMLPGEKVKIYIWSDFKHYLEVNNIDTLLYNTRTSRPKHDYGPYITRAKHASGKVESSSLVFLNLNKKEVKNPN
jgi:hypothetical protein